MPKSKLNLRRLSKYIDQREIPTYTVSEAAHYLRIPASTIHSWLQGTTYEGKQRFKRVIEPPDPHSSLLSFYNLAEAHVLRALRTQHGLSLQHIRSALDYIKRGFGRQRPLIEQSFQTDGVRLFVERLGRLIDASAHGQLVMQELVVAHLERLEWKDELVARIYPFTRSSDADSPRMVIIDPQYSFGKPTLKTSGVATAIIAERYKAGDSIAHLARDYGCPQSEIEEGLRCELQTAA